MTGKLLDTTVLIDLSRGNIEAADFVAAVIGEQAGRAESLPWVYRRVVTVDVVYPVIDAGGNSMVMGEAVMFGKRNFWRRTNIRMDFVALTHPNHSSNISKEANI